MFRVQVSTSSPLLLITLLFQNVDEGFKFSPTCQPYSLSKITAKAPRPGETSPLPVDNGIGKQRCDLLFVSKFQLAKSQLVSGWSVGESEPVAVAS